MTDCCFNHTEAEERQYLESIKSKITSELEALGKRVHARHTEMVDLQIYLQENKADLDHVEKASARQSIDMMASIVEHGAAQKMRLSKLLNSPYFGRWHPMQDAEAS